MQELIEHIEVGKSYIYLDGFFIPKDEEDFIAEEWNSKHDFPKVPQVLALDDPSVLENVLGNANYWRENEI